MLTNVLAAPKPQNYELFTEARERCELSVIVPVFNEDKVIRLFHERLIAVLSTCVESFEVVYVDDGSSDGTADILEALRKTDSSVGIARLSRNFGKERAMTAGLELAIGNAAVILDVDLQDPPELIPSMLQAWRAGADVVNMQRDGREGETALKKTTAHFFYRIINSLSDVAIPNDVGDFRLFSRRTIDALNRLPESNRFMKGLFAWVGFPQVTLKYRRQARAAGVSKWPYWKLWNFALEGVTSFSTAPLKVATYIGFLSASGAFIYAFYFLIKTQIWGEAVRGFPTLILVTLMLGGLQLMAIGIVGEYVGRIYLETKRRPLYLLDSYKPAGQKLDSGKQD
jgi:polyisoprenyl-phosphate glycosyltransferase